MRLFSYKMTHDTGFAPNPYWGSLTLATCKPGIRQTRGVGDWIAGFTSGALCGDRPGLERLVFLMEVAERLTIAEYFLDRRFQKKIPGSGPDHRRQVGDNIYRPRVAHAVEPRDFDQVPNISHPPVSREDDVGGRHVLIATRFVYFGRNALKIPAAVRPEVPRGQARFGQQTHDSERARRFIEYVEGVAGLKGVIVGMPHQWPEEGEAVLKACAVPHRKCGGARAVVAAKSACGKRVQVKSRKGCG